MVVGGAGHGARGVGGALVGLAALDREEALKQFEKVDVGGETGNLFQIEGKAEGQTAPARIITAMVHRDDASWFYKLS